MNKLVKAVRAYAIIMYDTMYEKGWDVIVEAYTDEEIEELIWDCTTATEAIARVRKVISIREMHANEIRNA